MWKWFGEGPEPKWMDAAYSAIELANGSTLNLVGTGAQVSTEKLAGWGAVMADNVTVAAGGELAVAVSPESLSSRTPVLLVGGTLNFGEDVGITLNVSGKLPTGKFPLVSADALGGIDLSNVTVAGGSNRSFELTRQGNVIYVNTRKKGLIVLVR